MSFRWPCERYFKACAYAEVLTPYAFKHVKKQVELANLLTVEQVLPEDKVVIKSHSLGQVTVTPHTCHCTYPVKMGLLCRHILKARTVLNLSRFDKSLCLTRWTIDYYNKASEKGVTPTSTTTNVDVMSTEKKKCTTLTQAQKFRRAMDTARTLATLASDRGMQTFNARMADLQNMLNLWQTQDRLGTNQSNMRSSNTEGSVNDPLKPTESMKETKKRRKVQRDIDKDFDDIPYRKRDFGPLTSHKE